MKQTILILALALASCGARKVNKSATEVKETTKTDVAVVDSSKTNTSTNENTKIVFDLQTNEFTVTPVDTTKTSKFGEVVFKNAVLKHRNTKNNSILDKTITEAKTEQKAVKTSTKQETAKDTKVDVKEIDKKQFNFLSLWWLLLIIPAYYLWRKYKGLIV